MAIVYGFAGWVRVDTPSVPGDLYLRLSAAGVVEMYLDGAGREITPAQLRRLPLARLRAQAESRPDLLLGMSTLNGAPDPGIREQLASAFPDGAARARAPRQVKLKPPTGGLTPAFLADVAAAYRSAVAMGQKPNKALAEQTGHPVRSVERWVYLARKSGHLPPTRPGEAR
jgi:hypothetical protein